MILLILLNMYINIYIQAEKRLLLITLLTNSKKYSDLNPFQIGQLRETDLEKKLEARARRFYIYRKTKPNNYITNNVDINNIEIICHDAINSAAYLWITSHELKPEYCKDRLNEFEVMLCVSSKKMILDLGNGYYPFNDIINNNIEVKEKKIIKEEKNSNDISIQMNNLYNQNIIDYRTCIFCQY